jgi:putative membrane protein
MDIFIERVHGEMGSPMRTSGYFLFFGGLALFTLLIGYYGLADIAGALAFAGWGLLWVTAFHLLPLVINTVAWRRLFDDRSCPSFTVMVWARWIGESINQLLPAAQVGGYLAKARLLIRHGVPGPISGASVVAELTVNVVSQIIFTLLGVGLLFYIEAHEVLSGVLVGLFVMTMLIMGFCIAQRLGMFGGFVRVLTHFGSNRDWQSLVGGATSLDDAIRQIYGNRRRLITAGLWRLCGWIAGAGEVWLALYFLGVPVDAKEALLLESLGQAVRAAGFLIPGAVGVQEGGFLMLGSLVGLGPEVSLALSLTKRVRELVLGVPGLIVWQVAEGRQFWLRSRKVVGDSSQDKQN